jgi:dihydroneopterin aldolase
MSNTIKIALEGLKVKAFHGVYDEEKIIGNTFEIDIYIEVENVLLNDLLDRTVDYEEVNTLIVNEMKQRQDLLETVALNIINKIKIRWQIVQKVKIRIKKKNLPFTNKIKNVMIELTQ